MLPPIPSPPPGVAIANDTSTSSVRYPVFAAVVSGQVIKEYVSSSKLYYVPSTGVLNATSFAGAGTGLTGTAASLSIGGNAATATLATAATNLAGGVANNMAYQTGAGATAFITAPSTSGSYLQWTSVGGFAWTPFSGVTSFSAGTTGFTPNVSTTGAITLAGTLGAANGGTGATTLTGYVYGNGAGVMTASATIPNTAISGLGSMSTQNANNVAITGGSINGTTIGGSVAAAGSFTYVTANQSITGSSSTGAFSYGALTYSDVNLFASYKTNVNSYAQIVIQNAATGTAASTDFVVSNDLGTSSSNYGDFGINSSAFVGTGSLGGAGYVYMYAQGTDLAIGTGSNNAIHLVVNGGATDAMTINGSGAVAFNGSYGTSSYLLQGGGAAAAPSWINPSSLSVGSANNLVGGNSGYVPYQSAASTTAFVSAGTTGQVFTSGGTGSPTWTSQSALSVGTATNIAGGSANQIHYQSSAGVTSFITAPTVSSTFLQWSGSAFTWVPISAIGISAVTGTAPITVTTTLGTANVSLASSYGDTQNPYASKTANTFLAAPNGSAGVPTFRSIVAADIPTLNQNTTGTAANITGVLGISNGGTNLNSTPTNGQLLIGNGSGFSLATLSAGNGILITNTPGSITIATNNTYSGRFVVVGGGASGGANWGGGGGAGGYIEGAQPLAIGVTYPVFVGAGGSGVTGGLATGNNGSNSVIFDFTALGGGGGSCAANSVANSGGCGGGAGQNAGPPTPGSGTLGQGYSGGTAVTSNGAGGGGGGGGTGGNASTLQSGNGGVGVSTNISGSSVYYAGGGGAGGYTSG